MPITPAFFVKSNVALQRLMQAAMSPADMWTLERLKRLPEWTFRWEFMNERVEMLPCEHDLLCDRLIQKGYVLCGITVSQSAHGVTDPNSDPEMARSLAKLFGDPFMVTERWYGLQSMWRVTRDERKAFDGRYVTEDMGGMLPNRDVVSA